MADLSNPEYIVNNAQYQQSVVRLPGALNQEVLHYQGMENVLQKLQRGEKVLISNQESTQIVEHLISCLHTLSLGNEVGKENFLAHMDDLNSGKVPQRDLDMKYFPVLVEVLVTVRDYDLLDALFSCTYLNVSDDWKNTLLKKSIRLGDSELLEFLIARGFGQQNLDKKSVIFSIVKGVMHAGRTASQDRMDCCRMVFKQLYSPEDAGILDEVVGMTIRNKYFSPRTIMSSLKSSQENTVLIQFLRCRPNYNPNGANLFPVFDGAIKNFVECRKFMDYPENDIRVTSIGKVEISPETYDSYLESQLYLIDILVTWGILEEVNFNVDAIDNTEVLDCIESARKTKHTCESFSADPRAFQDTWFVTPFAKDLGPDVIALSFEFLGSFKA